MEWKSAGGRLRQISSNLGGLWGVAHNGDVFYRNGTYEQAHSFGSGWWQVEGKLQQLSVGWNSVWGVDQWGQVWYRHGIDIEHILGTRWINVPTPGPFKQVSVDRLGHLWALNEKNDVYYRVGACLDQVAGLFWRKIGDRRMAQIDAGKSGVWAVDENKEVFYRMGTYGENGSEGTDWVKVDPGTVLLLQLSSGGEDMMLGITYRGELYMRDGMSSANPTGIGWKRLPGELTFVDVYGYNAWGISRNHEVLFSHCYPRSEFSQRLLRDTLY